MVFCRDIWVSHCYILGQPGRSQIQCHLPCTKILTQSGTSTVSAGSPSTSVHTGLFLRRTKKYLYVCGSLAMDATVRAETYKKKRRRRGRAHLQYLGTRAQQLDPVGNQQASPPCSTLFHLSASRLPLT